MEPEHEKPGFISSLASLPLNVRVISEASGKHNYIGKMDYATVSARIWCAPSSPHQVLSVHKLIM